MEALKSSLPTAGLIDEGKIRQAMRTKSVWLSRVVMAELVTLPILALFLFSLAISTGMSVWLMVVFVVLATLDAVLDIRTFAISKKLIQDGTPAELSKKLLQQKMERQRQTIVSTLLLVPWLIWFVYEYLKHDAPFIPGEKFVLVWGVVSAVFVATSLCIIRILYEKAQNTNDELINEIKSFDEDE